MKHSSLILATCLLLGPSAGAQDVELTAFKARNGIEFEYAVLTPAKFNPDEAHPVLFAFPPGDMDEGAVRWSIENLWGDEETRGDWVIVIPTIPRDSWHTHPAHHALEEFLDGLSEEYHAEDMGLHLTGYANGARAAITYASMSSEYWSSLTVAGPAPWNEWRESSLRRWPQDNKHIPIHVLVGEHDADGLEAVERISEPFTAGGVKLTTTVVPGYGEGLESLLGGRMIAVIAENAGM